MRAVFILLLISLSIEAGVYRWVDERGRVHYGDNPPSSADVATMKMSSERKPVTVIKVLDGDTIVLEGGEKLRLIGINTPEVARRGRRAEDGANKARDTLKAMLEGRQVRIQMDQESKDAYGRLLAHVFLADGRNVSQQMLAQGLGHMSVYPPNLEHVSIYHRAEQEARRRALGIWALPHFQTLTVAQALQQETGYVRVMARVIHVEERLGWDYMDLDGGLRVGVRRMDEAWVGDMMPYLEQTIEVWGWRRKLGDRPGLLIRHGMQIQTRYSVQ